MPSLLLRRLLLVALLACALPVRAQESDVPECPAILPARIDEIEIVGLWRTREHVVRRELPWKAGEIVTAAAWELGLTRLWNLMIFSRVEAHLEERDGRRIVVFRLEERWTVNLMLRAGGGGGVAWLRTGLFDINTLGRFLETGVLYERFEDFNGGQAWLRNPRLFDERQELAIDVARLSRPRRDFTVLRSSVRAEFTRQLDETLWFGGRAELFSDLLQPLATVDGVAQETLDSAQTGLLGPVIRVGRIDTVRLRQRGYLLDLRPHLGLTNAPGFFGLAQFSAELLLFKPLGTRLNLAARLRTGYTTSVPVAQQFHLGGLDMIRGFPDNHLRGNGYALANLEARFIAFDSTWAALIPIAFLDVAMIRDLDERSPKWALSAGAGLRAMVPRFVRSGLRLDVAWPLSIGTVPALAFGIYQFF